MRSLPRLDAVTRPNGVVEYTVVSRASWLAITWLDLAFLATALLTHYKASAAALHWLLLLAWLYYKAKTRRYESILAARNLGVQLSSQLVLDVPWQRHTKRGPPLTRCSKLFCPASAVQDIILLEGIHGWSILWYLGIVVADDDGTRLEVVFKHALPRLHILQKAYRAVRSTMQSGSDRTDQAAHPATKDGEDRR